MSVLSSTDRFLVIDRCSGEVAYAGKSLAQVKGWTDADESDKSFIVACSCEMRATEFSYQIVLVDESSGQVLCHGPVVDLFDAPELLLNVVVVLLPVHVTLRKGGEA